jgi:hypothetical protein
MGGVTVRDVDVSFFWESLNPAILPRTFSSSSKQFPLRSFSESETIDENLKFSAVSTSSSLPCTQLQAQKFIEAYSAFLKRQGKLQIPGSIIASNISR